MSFEKIWLIPLCTTMCSIAAFFVSYMLAVSNGHVTTFWPYISDSGAMPPESCIFGQLLNMAALFLAATVYLRHRQIVEFYWHRLKQVGRWRSASCALLWIGYTSAFGVSMVANFQENNVISVHYFGALLAFGCGLIYAWAQTVFSYSMNPKLASPIVSHCRLALCICSTVFFFMTIIFGPILGHQPPRVTDEKHCKELYIWKGDEDTYFAHTVGTVSEWVLAICFQLYILSFVIELRHAYCHAPKLKLLTFCEEDSETGMVITQATIDMHCKLSRKGISCITLPGEAAVAAFGATADGAVHGGYEKGDGEGGVQIWIHTSDSLARLGRLRRGASDAYLQAPHFRHGGVPPRAKRPTISHCPPYNAAMSPTRDSGFLDVDGSARSSRAPSPLKFPVAKIGSAATMSTSTNSKPAALSFPRQLDGATNSPPPRSPPPSPPSPPKSLNAAALGRLSDDGEFAEVILADIDDDCRMISERII